MEEQILHGDGLTNDGWVDVLSIVHTDQWREERTGSSDTD